MSSKNGYDTGIHMNGLVRPTYNSSVPLGLTLQKKERGDTSTSTQNNSQYSSAAVMTSAPPSSYGTSPHQSLNLFKTPLSQITLQNQMYVQKLSLLE